MTVWVAAPLSLPAPAELTELFAGGLPLTTEGFFDGLAATYKPPERYTKLSRSQRTDRDLGFPLVAGYTLRDGRRSGSLSLKNITTDVVDRLFDKLLIVHEPVLGTDGTPVLDGEGQPVTRWRERRTVVKHAMESCRRAWNVVRRGNPKIVPEPNPFSRMGLKDTSKETPTHAYGQRHAFVAACDANGHASVGSAAMVA